MLVEAGPDLSARLDAHAGLAPLLLHLPGPDVDLDATLAVALPRIVGVVLRDCRDAGDAVRLGTRLGVAEAELNLPAGAIGVLAELAPAALLAPMGLASARPRLAGLLWDSRALAEGCGAAPEAFGGAGTAEMVRTLVALAGAALALPVYDTASDDAQLRADAEQARRLGFAGKVAAHPGQVPVLRRAFPDDPVPFPATAPGEEPDTGSGLRPARSP